LSRATDISLREAAAFAWHLAADLIGTFSLFLDEKNKITPFSSPSLRRSRLNGRFAQQQGH
jgi:hypothetical protein